MVQVGLAAPWIGSDTPALPFADPYPLLEAGRLWLIEPRALYAVGPEGELELELPLDCAHPISSSLSPDAQTVYVSCVDDSSVLALALPSGQLRFRRAGRLHAVGTDGALWWGPEPELVDGRSGKTLRPWAGVDLSPIPLAEGWAQEDRELQVLDRSGKILWTRPERQGWKAFDEGRGLARHEDGRLLALRAQDGQVLLDVPVPDHDGFYAAGEELWVLQDGEMTRWGRSGRLGSFRVPLAFLAAERGRLWAWSQGTVRTFSPSGAQLTGPAPQDQLWLQPMLGDFVLLDVSDGARHALYVGGDKRPWLRQGARAEPVPVDAGWIWRVALSRDGKRVALLGLPEGQKDLELLELHSGPPSAPVRVPLPRGVPQETGFTDDGKLWVTLRAPVGLVLLVLEPDTHQILTKTVLGDPVVPLWVGPDRVWTWGVGLSLHSLADGYPLRRFVSETTVFAPREGATWLFNSSLKSWPEVRAAGRVETGYVALSPDGSVAVRQTGETLELRSVADERLLAELPAPEAIALLRFDPTGQVLLVATPWGQVDRFDVPSGGQPLPDPMGLRTARLLQRPPLSGLPSSSGRTCEDLVASGEGIVGTYRDQLCPGGGEVEGEVLALGGGQLALWSRGQVSLLDEKGQAKPWLEKVARNRSVNAGQIAWRQEGDVHVRSVSGHKQVYEQLSRELELAITSDGLIVRTFWDKPIVEARDERSLHDLEVDGCLLTPASSRGRIAVSTSAGPVFVWHPASEEVVAVLETGPGCARVAFSPDAERLVTWNDEQVLVFDLAEPDRPLAWYHTPGEVPDSLAWDGGQIGLSSHQFTWFVPEP